MTLNIKTSQRVTGINGAAGIAGAEGSSLQRNGGSGTDGKAGSRGILSLSGTTFQGDSGGDTIILQRNALGGQGGVGGSGGGGKDSQSTGTTIVTETPDNSSNTTTIVWDTPGNGGAGGRGGAGGAATVRFGSLNVLFAGGLASPNLLSLQGDAQGGVGGQGSSSGSGGTGGSSMTSRDTSKIRQASGNLVTFTRALNQQGTPAGLSPEGASGGVGGGANLRFNDIQVSGENVEVVLGGTASGGGGANGGGSFNETRFPGSTGMRGNDGGRGGAAGKAVADVRRLDIGSTKRLKLSIQLTAVGQRGGGGGQAGGAGFGKVENSFFTNGAGTMDITSTYAAAGNGGAGGAGGAAVVRVLDSRITGSEGADSVSISLSATGGVGGLGSLVGPAVANSSQVINSGAITQTITTIGTPAGLKGIDGITGLATVEMKGNRIPLGDGDDTLSMFLFSSASSRVTVSGNKLDGGRGRDTLVLGNGRAGEPAATIDVANGTLRLGSTPVLNTLRGFEVFTATSAADRIIDGGGNQEYRGGFGLDRYTFSAGFTGNDVIRDFNAEDQIVFSGFGSPLDSLDDLRNNATPDPSSGGTRITTSDSSSVVLAGFDISSLKSEMFSF
jgi:hypothetical protein